MNSYLIGPPKIRLGPTDTVSIIGFPFGQTAGGPDEYYGIWTQGTLASEPLVDFEGLPSFLVDSRTRKGQSGSPVIAYREAVPTVTTGNSYIWNGSVIVDLVGVYCGRINDQSDLGRVTKASVIAEILDGQKPGSLDT